MMFLAKSAGGNFLYAFFYGALDIWSSLSNFSLIALLAWQDVKQRYKRSMLGPFWLTLSMGIMIGVMGVVFGGIFNSPVDEFFPFLSLGIIIWGVILGAITESCSSFISSEAIIKQLPIPLFTHVARSVLRNIIIFFHNILIFPFVMLWVGRGIDWSVLLAIPGFLLLVVNLGWISLVASIVCSRYRDLPQMISSLLQVYFYLTPVIWMPALLPDRYNSYFLDFNPFYHLLEVTRSPLLGQIPDLGSWVFCIAMGGIGWVCAMILFGRYKNRIAYWV